jgi:hypothetical protein
VAAGLCALVAAWICREKVISYQKAHGLGEEHLREPLVFREGYEALAKDLILIAAVTFIAAFALAFLFTYLRSRKAGVAIWGYTARRVMINVLVPMLAGGLLVWRMMQLGVYGLIAPACLLFYGLALINGSKYTLTEIRYLGYGQLILGALNLWMLGYGLYFWAAGFGLLHIIYGIVMWNKYERTSSETVTV